MQPIILILSCGRDRSYHQQVRNTWLKDSPVDYKFLLGVDQYQSQKDELITNVGDGYWQVAAKVKEGFRYTFDQEYSHVFKCDIDTYCHIPRLLISGFEQHDWIGNGMPYGGSGYWLSRHAISLLLDKPTDRREGEDYWISRNLREIGFIPFQDDRYHSRTIDGPRQDNQIITSHWYSEINENGERFVKYKERLDLIPKYYEDAKEIK